MLVIGTRFHLQTDTFRHRKLYQGYDQNKTPSEEPENENCSHKQTLRFGDA